MVSEETRRLLEENERKRKEAERERKEHEAELKRIAERARADEKRRNK